MILTLTLDDGTLIEEWHEMEDWDLDAPLVIAALLHELKQAIRVGKHMQEDES